MATSYPTSIKNFLILEDGVDKVIAQHPNERADEITAIETELGTLPKGTCADLKTRLAVSLENDGTLKRGVIQVVNVMDGAVATGTTMLPHDDSIPQITEGDQYMTLAITPKSATNKLKIEVVFNGSSTVTNYFITAALFQGATANALAIAEEVCASTGTVVNISFTHYMTAGTTAATTFRVRAGAAGGGTTTFNGSAGGRLFGGVMASSITITELYP